MDYPKYTTLTPKPLITTRQTTMDETLAEEMKKWTDSISPAEPIMYDDPVSLCGAPVHWGYNPLRGGYTVFVMFCGDYLNCDYCREYRINLLSDRIDAITQEPNVAIIYATIAQTKLLAALLKRPNYYRIPKDDGTCMFAFRRTTGFASYDSTPLIRPTREEIEEMVLHAPKGKHAPKLYGGLGKSGTNTKHQRRRKGRDTLLYRNLTVLRLNTAAQAKIAVTVSKEMGPPNTKSIMEFQAYTNAYQDRYIKALEKAGAQVNEFERKGKINLEEVSTTWQPGLDCTWALGV